MAEAKYFDNLILGQYLLTGVPIDVYVDGRYLTLTDIDDVEDPLFGFGMDMDGKMHEFDYRNIAQLKIGDNIVDLQTYNERMKALQEPAEEEPAEDEEPAEEEPAEEEPAEEEPAEEEPAEEEPAEEEPAADEEETTTEESYMPSLKSLLEKAESEAQATAARIALAVKRGKLPKSKLKGASKEMYKMSAKDLEDFTKAKKGAPKKVTEISRDEFKAQEKSYKADIEAAEAKKKSAEAKKKSAEEKLTNLKREPIEDSYDPEISAPYVYQVGDLVQNTNTSCPHYGSKGIVKGLMDLDDDMGTVVMYRVTNNGDTFKPGMTLAKTMDQLTPIDDEDDDEF